MNELRTHDGSRTRAIFCGQRTPLRPKIEAKAAQKEESEEMTNAMANRTLPPLTRLALGTTITSGGCWLYDGKPCCKGGYIKIGHDKTKELIHRFSFRTFKGKIAKGKFVLHRCVAHPNCWNPNHLYAGGFLENAKDRKAQGREPDRRGEKNGHSCLEPFQVREIKNATRQIRSHELARIYGCSASAIRHIRAGHTWKHVL